MVRLEISEVLPCKHILLYFSTYCLNLSLFKQFTMKILSYTQSEQQLLCLQCSTRMNIILIWALLLVVFLSSSSSPDRFNVVIDLNISDSILQQWFRMLLFDNHWLTTSDGHDSLWVVLTCSTTQHFRVSAYSFVQLLSNFDLSIWSSYIVLWKYSRWIAFDYWIITLL